MLFLGLIPLFFIAIAVLSTIFWIVTLIDCAINEPSEGNDKIIWILVILFLHVLGALIYRLARRPERLRRYGK